jgi:hypothetical protein
MSSEYTKRVTIPLDLYNKLFTMCNNKMGTKGDVVASQINTLYNDYNTLVNKECLELSDKSKERMKVLVSMGLYDNYDAIIENAIEKFVDDKKEEIIEKVKSL